MVRFSKVVAVALSLLMIGPSVRWTAASTDESLISRQDIDDAIRQAVLQEEDAREAIRTLLNREDVRSLAKESGIGTGILERATGAVGALEGAELAEAAAYAAELNDQLAGGDTINISISLVALLLIIILVLVLTQ